MTKRSLTTEQWREYEFGGRVYRINKPQWLYVGKTTHRIVDANNVVHCVPTVGAQGCVLRWKNVNDQVPVNF